MSKKELDFEKLGPKKSTELKPEIDTEKAVALIHDKKEEKERTKRITIDIPFSLYVDVRTRVVKEEKTLKDYFLGLARKDMKP